MLLERYLLRLFLPTFAIALVFFALIVELADVFSSIFRYVQNNVDILTVLKIQGLFLPKSLVLGMPIAAVFAATFVMGNLQVRFELLGFLASGIGVIRVAAPILVLSGLICVASFTTNEFAAVGALRAKESAIDKAIGRPPPLSSSDMVIYDKLHQRIWRAGFYNNQTEEIQNLTVVQRTENGTMTSMVQSSLAKWQTNHWQLTGVKTTFFDADDKVRITTLPTIDDASYALEPRNFRGTDIPIDTQDLSDAWIAIQRRVDTGLSYRKELTRYHERYSFAMTPAVVTLLAISAGRRFKKHVLLLSLLVSLGLAVVYYVIQLVAALFSTVGILPPVIGAWTGCIVCLIAGAGLLWRSQKV